MTRLTRAPLRVRLAAVAQAVGEALAARRGAVSTLALALPGVALAGPTGEQVVAGSAAVSRPDAHGTVIDQASNRAVINWQTFSVGGNEYVRFNQPGTASVALNRVTGVDASRILGRMDANGRVFLVNPRGVYFGPGAQVDVGALVASAHEISNEDFLAGRYVFTRAGDGADAATVVNAGTITAADGGFVVLAGDYVENSGVVSARLGTVALAAGGRVSLDVGDTGLVSYAVDEATVSELAGVRNSGEITADGGRVVMTAKVAGDLVSTAVNNQGLVRAQGIVERNGEVWLTGSGGDVAHGGTIDVSGQAGQGGGDVRIVGDRNITLAPDSRIEARGDGAASGGDVRVVAARTTEFKRQARIDVQGGNDGGAGGFVELSGEHVRMRGELALGKGGTLLIDPADIVIRDGAYGGFYGGGLGGYGGDIFFEQDLEAFVAAGNNIELVATNSITLENLTDDVLDLTGAGSGGSIAMGIGIGSFASATFVPSSVGGTISFADVNDSLLADAAVRMVAGSDGLNGAGTILIGDVEARQIFVGVTPGGAAGAAAVSAGNLRATNPIGPARVHVFGDGAVTTGTLTSLGASSLIGDVDVQVHADNGTATVGDISATVTGGVATVDLVTDGDLSFGRLDASGTGGVFVIGSVVGGNINGGAVDLVVPALNAGNVSLDLFSGGVTTLSTIGASTPSGDISLTNLSDGTVTRGDLSATTGAGAVSVTDDGLAGVSVGLTGVAGAGGLVDVQLLSGLGSISAGRQTLSNEGGGTTNLTADAQAIGASVDIDGIDVTDGGSGGFTFDVFAEGDVTIAVSTLSSVGGPVSGSLDSGQATLQLTGPFSLSGESVGVSLGGATVDVGDLTATASAGGANVSAGAEGNLTAGNVTASGQTSVFASVAGGLTVAGDTVVGTVDVSTIGDDTLTTFASASANVSGDTVTMGTASVFASMVSASAFFGDASATLNVDAATAITAGNVLVEAEANLSSGSAGAFALSHFEGVEGTTDVGDVTVRADAIGTDASAIARNRLGAPFVLPPAGPTTILTGALVANADAVAIGDGSIGNAEARAVIDVMAVNDTPTTIDLGGNTSASANASVTPGALLPTAMSFADALITIGAPSLDGLEGGLPAADVSAVGPVEAAASTTVTNATSVTEDSSAQILIRAGDSPGGGTIDLQGAVTATGGEAHIEIRNETSLNGVVTLGGDVVATDTKPGPDGRGGPVAPNVDINAGFGTLTTGPLAAISDTDADGGHVRLFSTGDMTLAGPVSALGDGTSLLEVISGGNLDFADLLAEGLTGATLDVDASALMSGGRGEAKVPTGGVGNAMYDFFGLGDIAIGDLFVSTPSGNATGQVIGGAGVARGAANASTGTGLVMVVDDAVTDLVVGTTDASSTGGVMVTETSSTGGASVGRMTLSEGGGGAIDVVVSGIGGPSVVDGVDVSHTGTGPVTVDVGGDGAALGASTMTVAGGPLAVTVAGLSGAGELTGNFTGSAFASTLDLSGATIAFADVTLTGTATTATFDAFAVDAISGGAVDVDGKTLASVALLTTPPGSVGDVTVGDVAIHANSDGARAPLARADLSVDAPTVTLGTVVLDALYASPIPGEAVADLSVQALDGITTADVTVNAVASTPDANAIARALSAIGSEAGVTKTGAVSTTADADGAFALAEADNRIGNTAGSGPFGPAEINTGGLLALATADATGDGASGVADATASVEVLGVDGTPIAIDLGADPAAIAQANVDPGVGSLSTGDATADATVTVAAPGLTSGLGGRPDADLLIRDLTEARAETSVSGAAAATETSRADVLLRAGREQLGTAMQLDGDVLATGGDASITIVNESASGGLVSLGGDVRVTDTRPGGLVVGGVEIDAGLGGLTQALGKLVVDDDADGGRVLLRGDQDIALLGDVTAIGGPALLSIVGGANVDFTNLTADGVDGATIDVDGAATVTGGNIATTVASAGLADYRVLGGTGLLIGDVLATTPSGDVNGSLGTTAGTLNRGLLVASTGAGAVNLTESGDGLTVGNTDATAAGGLLSVDMDARGLDATVGALTLANSGAVNTLVGIRSLGGNLDVDTATIGVVGAGGVLMELDVGAAGGSVALASADLSSTAGGLDLRLVGGSVDGGPTNLTADGGTIHVLADASTGDAIIGAMSVLENGGSLVDVRVLAAGAGVASHGGGSLTSVGGDAQLLVSGTGGAVIASPLSMDGENVNLQIDGSTVDFGDLTLTGLQAVDLVGTAVAGLTGATIGLNGGPVARVDLNAGGALTVGDVTVFSTGPRNAVASAVARAQLMGDTVDAGVVTVSASYAGSDPSGGATAEADVAAAQGITVGHITVDATADTAGGLAVADAHSFVHSAGGNTTTGDIGVAATASGANATAIADNRVGETGGAVSGPVVIHTGSLGADANASAEGDGSSATAIGNALVEVTHLDGGAGSLIVNGSPSAVAVTSAAPPVGTLTSATADSDARVVIGAGPTTPGTDVHVVGDATADAIASAGGATTLVETGFAQVSVRTGGEAGGVAARLDGAVLATGLDASIDIRNDGPPGGDIRLGGDVRATDTRGGDGSTGLVQIAGNAGGIHLAAGTSIVDDDPDGGQVFIQALGPVKLDGAVQALGGGASAVNVQGADVDFASLLAEGGTGASVHVDATTGAVLGGSVDVLVPGGGSGPVDYRVDGATGVSIGDVNALTPSGDVLGGIGASGGSVSRGALFAETGSGQVDVNESGAGMTVGPTDLTAVDGSLRLAMVSSGGDVTAGPITLRRSGFGNTDARITDAVGPGAVDVAGVDILDTGGDVVLDVDADAGPATLGASQVSALGALDVILGGFTIDTGVLTLSTDSATGRLSAAGRGGDVTIAGVDATSAGDFDLFVDATAGGSASLGATTLNAVGADPTVVVAGLADATLSGPFSGTGGIFSLDLDAGGAASAGSVDLSAPTATFRARGDTVALGDVALDGGVGGGTLTYDIDGVNAVAVGSLAAMTATGDILGRIASSSAGMSRGALFAETGSGQVDIDESGAGITVGATDLTAVGGLLRLSMVSSGGDVSTGALTLRRSGAGTTDVRVTDAVGPGSVDVASVDIADTGGDVLLRLDADAGSAILGASQVSAFGALDVDLDGFNIDTGVLTLSTDSATGLLSAVGGGGDVTVAGVDATSAGDFDLFVDATLDGSAALGATTVSAVGADPTVVVAGFADATLAGPFSGSGGIFFLDLDAGGAASAGSVDLSAPTATFRARGGTVALGDVVLDGVDRVELRGTALSGLTAGNVIASALTDARVELDAGRASGGVLGVGDLTVVAETLVGGTPAAVALVQLQGLRVVTGDAFVSAHYETGATGSGADAIFRIGADDGITVGDVVVDAFSRASGSIADATAESVLASVAGDTKTGDITVLADASGPDAFAFAANVIGEAVGAAPPGGISIVTGLLSADAVATAFGNGTNATAQAESRVDILGVDGAVMDVDLGLDPASTATAIVDPGADVLSSGDASADATITIAAPSVATDEGGLPAAVVRIRDATVATADASVVGASSAVESSTAGILIRAGRAVGGVSLRIDGDVLATADEAAIGILNDTPSAATVRLLGDVIATGDEAGVRILPGRVAIPGFPASTGVGGNLDIRGTISAVDLASGVGTLGIENIEVDAGVGGITVGAGASIVDVDPDGASVTLRAEGDIVNAGVVSASGGVAPNDIDIVLAGAGNSLSGAGAWQSDRMRIVGTGGNDVVATTSVETLVLGDLRDATLDNQSFTGPSQFDLFGTFRDVGITFGGDATWTTAAAGTTRLGSGGGAPGARSIIANSLVLGTDGALVMEGVQVDAAGRVNLLSGDALKLADAQLRGVPIDLIAGGVLDLDRAAVQSTGVVTLRGGGGILADTASIDAAAGVDAFTTQDVDLTGLQLNVTGAFVLQTNGAITLDGATIAADGPLDLRGGTGISFSGTELATTGAMVLVSGAGISGAGSELLATTGIDVFAAGPLDLGGGSVATTSGTTSLRSNSGVDLAGASVDAPGALDILSGAALDLSGATLSAGDLVRMQSGGQVSAAGVQLRGPNGIDVLSSSGIDLTGGDIDGGFFVRLQASGPVSLVNSRVRANPLAVITPGTISISGATMQLNGGLLQGGSVTNGPASITLGGGTVATVAGDGPLVDALAANDIPVASGSPNFAVVSQGAVNLSETTLNLGNAASYLWFQGSSIQSLGSVINAPSALLVQFAPSGGGSTISLEQTVGVGGDVNFGVLEHIDALPDTPGTTVAFGFGTDPLGVATPFAGDLFVSQDGALDLGSRNLVLLSAGEVFGAGGGTGIESLDIASSGLVLYVNGGVATAFGAAEEFETPTNDELNEAPPSIAEPGTGTSEEILSCN
ncbi:MAG: filamentous hemagglutinin N-terminal domain-containing protein [Ectothiorhodospiraceae bacterium]|nr:filamentous hemagglutinin N-terminal domain-containing protein [Ectothiorhodospiraceae bacterium]